MRSIREEFEEQEKQNRQQMFDKITVWISGIRKNVLAGEDPEEIAAELEVLEALLS